MFKKNLTKIIFVIFIITLIKPENSYAVLEEMKLHVEDLIASLELPFRMLRLCDKDLGFTAAIT